jgi:hypothetical protein
MTKVEIPAHAGKLVAAVASIGYDPEVALCDLMDNCVDAGAKTIRVQLEEQFNDEEGTTDTVGRYIIVDDGSGMDEQGLKNAFTLGSERDYPAGSLGKFGLGLKSAGLSLGNKLALVSKQSDTKLCCAVLEVSDIQQYGKYRIDLGDPPDHYLAIWETLAPSSDHGTLLIIEEPTDSQPAFQAFTTYFRRHVSNIYHLFLSPGAGSDTASQPIAIEVNGTPLIGIDPLFLEEARANGSLGNPEDWDGRDVRLLLDDTPLSLGAGADAIITATQLIHPPSFAPDGSQKEMRDRYQIEVDPYTRLPRHGFFVYRNRRIIVMAERFWGLVSSQTAAWAFRGRLMMDEGADAVLALDVKKRHIKLSKAARSNLKGLIANYHSKSVDAWKNAGAREAEWKKERKDAAANESIVNTPVADLDYTPGTEVSSTAEIDARRQRQQQIGVETLASLQDDRVTKETITERAQQKDRVIKVSGMKGNAMWLPYAAVELGAAETMMNTQHTWVAEVLAAAQDDPRITIILYQMLTILARAELEVRSTTWPDVKTDQVEKVLDRFRRKASTFGEDLAESLGAELQKISGSDVGD